MNNWYILLLFPNCQRTLFHYLLLWGKGKLSGCAKKSKNFPVRRSLLTRIKPKRNSINNDYYISINSDNLICLADVLRFAVFDNFKGALQGILPAIGFTLVGLQNFIIIFATSLITYFRFLLRDKSGTVRRFDLFTLWFCFQAFSHRQHYRHWRYFFIRIFCGIVMIILKVLLIVI